MNNLFITATGQDKGKTAFTVGLLDILRDELDEVGYMKPIGQRYVVTQGQKVDEDVELIDSIFNFPDSIKDMSPVIMDRGFTRANLGYGNTQKLTRQLMDAYHRLRHSGRTMVLEGAGRCSVGDNFGLSNMKIAELMGAGVILIAEGGIGRTIDECMLDMAYMKQFDVDILGVVINKVYRKKLQEITEVTGGALQDRGLDLLGVIPYEPVLESPTLRSVVDEMDVEFLTSKNESYLKRTIGTVLVGAMKPHQALGYLQGGELLITGGDREDILVAVLCWSAMSHQDPGVEPVTGIVVTGGIRPHDSLIDVAEQLDVQMFLVSRDTYAAASAINDLTVKIKPEDDAKIASLSGLIESHVDIDRLKDYIRGG